MPIPAHGESEAERSVLNGLIWAVRLTTLVLVIESVGAYFGHSLALTIDAFHNIPDVLAFAISWGSLAATRKGTTPEHTFGLHRTEVLATLLNGLLVLGTGLVFGYEALLDLVTRTLFAGSVDPLWILLAAVPVLVLRTVAAAIIGRVPRRARDMNLRAVFLHLWSDIAITGAILVAGVVLLLRPGDGWVDAGAALGIGGVLVWESLPLFRDSWASLTERTPSHLSVEAITQAARTVPRVEDLHDVHVWSVCSNLVCMTAHVSVSNVSVRESMEVLDQLRQKMADEFGIVHAVFETETRAP
jgi:cobalt-zinc-cadmium efflux system protein